MSKTAPMVPPSTLTTTVQAQPLKMKCVKALAESPGLNSIPSTYTYSTHLNESSASDPQDSIPSLILLHSSHSTLINGLKSSRISAKPVNGVPEAPMNMVIEKSNEFFNTREEEKQEFEAKHVLDPTRHGTSFNATKDKVLFWRDFLKVFMHPEFHSPNKPFGYSELLFEYCKRVREVARELLKGISDSLGLEEFYMEKALDLDSSLQIFIANLYPPCIQPELAMGMPPHSHHGLLTLLVQNGVGEHKGKWVNVNALPNSFLVNIGDHLQIFSNGKYKSVEHRAVVNNKITRISIAVTNGPSFDTVVRPAWKRVDGESHLPAYIPMKYREYLELQQGNQLNGKSCLDWVRGLERGSTIFL